MAHKPAVSKCSFPQPIMTIHGPGYLIGCDPQRRLVCVGFSRDDVTDKEMLLQYSGDTWNAMLDEADIIVTA